MFRRKLLTRTTVYVYLGFIMLFIIACGSAAQDTTPSAPAAAPQAASSAPTAVPAAADGAVVSGTTVSPGRVTMMLGGFNAEVFDLSLIHI